MNASRVVAARSMPMLDGFPLVNGFPLAHQGLWVITLVVALLVSALGLVYIKDLNRRFFIESQQIKQHKMIATEQRNELLLEKGNLIAQPRVERVAIQHLGMITPEREATQVLQLG